MCNTVPDIVRRYVVEPHKEALSAADSDSGSPGAASPQRQPAERSASAAAATAAAAITWKPSQAAALQPAEALPVCTMPRTSPEAATTLQPVTTEAADGGATAAAVLPPAVDDARADGSSCGGQGGAFAATEANLLPTEVGVPHHIEATGSAFADPGPSQPDDVRYYLQ